MFDREVLCRDEDADRLVTIARNLIGLERKNYLAAMRAIRTYVASLHRLADDLDLAYTLLVASVESLAQGFDGYRGEWADYDETRRQAIDKALANADDETAKAVRDTLLEIEHTSLARRFRAFTLEHIRPSYFRQEAAGLFNPVGRTELRGVLREAYRLRSKYVHKLNELPKLLTLGFDHGETVQIDRVTLLTIQGMARLARHVITEFVKRQPKVKTENTTTTRSAQALCDFPLPPNIGLARLKG